MKLPTEPMKTRNRYRSKSRLAMSLLAGLLLAGCTGLSTTPVASQTTYVLEKQTVAKPSPIKRNLVLLISEMQARPGFDTVGIAYVQKQHEVNYFVTSRWADTPARMLEPILVQAMQQAGGFRSIVQAADAVPADIRLDTELIHLQQDFIVQPSRVLITLRVQLIDIRAQRVLAVKQFDETENTTSENAYGGVTAANRALQRLLDRLVDFSVGATAAP